MTPSRKRRSLVLAGGGLKVAFQAGVLQVWLDEAGIEFDHVDAASGGVFNLAMLCQGMNGSEIAECWRRTNPRDGISVNAAEMLKLAYADSLFTLDNFRRYVFPAWGLDWSKIRSSGREATFNVFNFSRKAVEILEPLSMSEDMLVACVSLPMWFPPVRLNGQTYIDAVFLTDGNLEEAIRRGADEIWVIWTVSDRDEWQSGFVANYFQIIETSACGHYRAILERIARNNTAIAAGESGEFGRVIEVRELKAEVPLHYLIDFSQDRLVEAVNLGVERARDWCHTQGIVIRPTPGDYPTEVHAAFTRLSFTEEMKGFATFGETDCDRGSRRGKQAGTGLMFHLTITIDGVNRFVLHPEHETTNLHGFVRCDALGGDRAVEQGWFNLFVDDQDPARKWMRYRLFFSDGADRKLTLSGFKDIKDDPGWDLWQDTTTLFTRILDGHVHAAEERVLDETSSAHVLAAGILTIHLPDFLKQLATFRVEGPTLADRSAAMARFGRLFAGKLWDVYAREVLTSGPV